MSDPQNPYGNNPYGNQTQNPMGQNPNPYGNQPTPNPNNPYSNYPSQPQLGAPQYGGPQYGNQPQSQFRSKKGAPDADLGKRFLGALADGFCGIVAIGPGYGMIISSAALQDVNGNQQELPAMALFGLLAVGIGMIVLFATQIYLITTRSQSIGKWLVGTQIVDNDTGQPAGFVKAGLIRAFLNGVIGAVPCVGGIYSLVDILFIFGQDRRCIHDLLANTRVVEIS